jgi:peptide/nickel transport system substrate-binding protein
VGRKDERLVLPQGDGLGRRQFLGGMAATGALVGAGGLLAACGGSGGTTSTVTPSASAAGRRKGGALRVGLTGSSGADTLDPHQGLTYLDTARAQALYSPLAQLNTQAQNEFVLAESITPHNSTKEWIIKLRPGITFHDGKPLTADDVIFTFRRIKGGNKGAGYSGANSLGPMDVAGLKAVDSHTVLVPFTQNYGSFLDQLGYWYYLYIVPVGFNPAKPNGTGPFKFQSFTQNQRSVFTRNENYFKTAQPYVDSVTIIDFSDSTSLQNALVTNVIDAAGGLEGPQIAALSSNSSVKTIASKTGAITPFTMRVDVAPFNDVRVRQALRLIVDRQQLIDSALDGFASLAGDVFSPFDPNSKHWTRQADIPQAKALLKQAGHANLTVTLTTSPVATGTVAMATVLAEQAKAAGVKINVNNVSPNTFFKTGKYLEWPFSQDFYNYSPYLAQVAQSFLPKSPFNETHWTLPANTATEKHYLSLNQQANTTLNPTTRRQIVQEMQTIDYNQGGYIIPCFIDALDAYSTKLTGYSAAKVGQPLADFSFEQWSFT